MNRPRGAARAVALLILERLRRAFTTFPTTRHWLEAGLLLACVAAVSAPIGLATGLLKLETTSDSLAGVALFALVAVLVPSLFEETLYRGLLLPHPAERRSRRFQVVSVVVNVPLFVAGHPLVAWLFVPASRELFYNGTFLCLCALFGLAASLAYLRSGSIWTCVAMHWCVVVAWKLWLGGWIMLLPE
ncbi:MAG: CPBP family glutamic-type intramembrane protease [Pirellulaceae bacterium]